MREGQAYVVEDRILNGYNNFVVFVLDLKKVVEDRILNGYNNSFIIHN